ncbi:MAG: OB-fold domain-containing protein [Trebonia sp.]|jgi:uncharacterized OB-fold protein
MRGQTQPGEPPDPLPIAGDQGGPARPYPAPVAAAFAEFFSGLTRHELTVRQCADCGALQWPPRPRCPRCRGDEFRAAVLPDRGIVHTFTVCYRAFDPWFASRTPYAIAVVEISDGIRLTGNYLGADPSELACGMPVRARYEAVDGHAFLGWVPTEGAPS